MGQETDHRPPPPSSAPYFGACFLTHEEEVLGFRVPRQRVGSADYGLPGPTRFGPAVGCDSNRREDFAGCVIRSGLISRRPGLEVVMARPGAGNRAERPCVGRRRGTPK